MAVDNFYRLIAFGPRRAASAFRRGVAQTVYRPAIATIDGWREFVPLSIKAIRKHYENVRRVTSVALDPFEISVWPTRQLVGGRVEIRYQFQTRNCEFIDFLKPLSRRFPALTFVLVTLSLDGSEIASFLVRRGSVRGWELPQARRQWHWNRARKRFGIDGEGVYDHDDATFFAEQRMLDEALAHWMPKQRARCYHHRGRTILPRRRAWWNRPKFRDLDFERDLELYELNVSAGFPK